MLKVNVPQLSEEWVNLKTGVPSASNFDKIVTSKGEPSKQFEKYLYQLAGERITGVKEETHQSSAMARGVEMETEAKALFSMIKGADVEEVGLCYPDEDKRYLCSPDGILASSQGLEIKCPLLHTQVKYLLDNKLPTDYVQQVQGSMLVTGFQSWYFMSYYPGMPPLVIEVLRDDGFCAKLKVELDMFCTKLDELETKLRRL